MINFQQQLQGVNFCLPDQTAIPFKIAFCQLVLSGRVPVQSVAPVGQSFDLPCTGVGKPVADHPGIYGCTADCNRIKPISEPENFSCKSCSLAAALVVYLRSFFFKWVLGLIHSQLVEPAAVESVYGNIRFASPHVCVLKQMSIPVKNLKKIRVVFDIWSLMC